jgi:pseudo-rSAM protein
VCFFKKEVQYQYDKMQFLLANGFADNRELKLHKYSEFEKLIHILQKYNLFANFHIHYQNVTKNARLLNLLSKYKFAVKLFVNFPINVESLKNSKQLLDDHNIAVNYNFIVESEKDCNFAEHLITDLEIVNFVLNPFYNKKNLSFFRENVFLSKNDILDAKPSVSDIYARQTVNSNYYGKLTIKNNGDVHSNINEKKTGNIIKATLHEFAYKEIKSGNSWRKTRNNVKPCNKCVYRFLCPPVSNYEYAIGKFNLCNLV